MKVRQQLANLAVIPQQNRDEFCDVIRLPLMLVWKLDRRAQGTRGGPALGRAAKAARKLHENFANLNANDRRWIDELWSVSPEYQISLPALPRLISELEHLFSVAVGNAPLLNVSYPEPDGKKRGTVKDLAFYEFVRYLKVVTEEWCGGEFTFDKNKNKGTLIEAVDILRPYLPKWVVPTPLPLMTIQRIISKRLYYTGFHGVTSI